jgi:methionyl-tRNA formyltransferase
VTQADRRRGRGGALQATPVKTVATELGVPVTHRMGDVLGVEADLGVVVAFGRIIPAAILAALPMVNLHLSLLPRWRGAAPIERAILAGDLYSGVSLMALDEGLDTGPVYETITVPIEPDESADELTYRLGELGTDALLGRLRDGGGGLGPSSPQVGEPTYAEKITVEDRHLDFSVPAAECLRVVRIGRAWTTFRGSRLIVHAAHVVDAAGGSDTGQRPGALLEGQVATASGRLGLDLVQLEGRAAQLYSLFANGAHVIPGEVLGDGPAVSQSGTSLRQ